MHTRNIIEQIRDTCLAPARSCEQNWEMDFHLSPSFCGFDGHFPGNPILPAVAQVMIAREAINTRTASNWSIVKMSRAKFQNMIPPGIVITVHWKETAQENELHCKCMLKVNESCSKWSPTRQ